MGIIRKLMLSALTLVLGMEVAASTPCTDLQVSGLCGGGGGGPIIDHRVLPDETVYLTGAQAPGGDGSSGADGILATSSTAATPGGDGGNGVGGGQIYIVAKEIVVSGTFILTGGHGGFGGHGGDDDITVSGGIGKKGGKGGKGGGGGSVILQAETITFNSPVFYLQGGDGGNGGDGGIGWGLCNTVFGVGGDGGEGGNGGNAGILAFSACTINNPDNYTVVTRPGSGGDGGNGGHNTMPPIIPGYGYPGKGGNGGSAGAGASINLSPGDGGKGGTGASTRNSSCQLVYAANGKDGSGPAMCIDSPVRIYNYVCCDIVPPDEEEAAEAIECGYSFRGSMGQFTDSNGNGLSDRYWFFSPPSDMEVSILANVNSGATLSVYEYSSMSLVNSDSLMANTDHTLTFSATGMTPYLIILETQNPIATFDLAVRCGEGSRSSNPVSVGNCTETWNYQNPPEGFATTIACFDERRTFWAQASVPAGMTLEAGMVDNNEFDNVSVDLEQDYWESPYYPCIYGVDYFDSLVFTNTAAAVATKTIKYTANAYSKWAAYAKLYYVVEDGSAEGWVQAIGSGATITSYNDSSRGAVAHFLDDDSCNSRFDKAVARSLPVFSMYYKKGTDCGAFDVIMADIYTSAGERIVCYVPANGSNYFDGTYNCYVIYLGPVSTGDWYHFNRDVKADIATLDSATYSYTLGFFVRGRDFYLDDFRFSECFQ